MGDSRKRRTRRLRWILGGITLLLLVGFRLGTDDSHHTNINYLVWKQGWTPNTWRQNYHLFLVDNDLRQKLEGKTVVELKKWFPELIPASRGTREQLESLAHQPMTDDEMVWVASYLEGFRLKDGRFDGVVHYDKG